MSNRDVKPKEIHAEYETFQHPPSGCDNLFQTFNSLLFEPGYLKQILLGLSFDFLGNSHRTDHAAEEKGGLYPNLSHFADVPLRLIDFFVARRRPRLATIPRKKWGK